ncbi:hypothetical protein D3C87_781710 [compost metagenome]
MDFTAAAGAGAAVGADDDGALAAAGRRCRVVAYIVVAMHRAPWRCRGNHLDAVGVTAGLRLGDRGGKVGKAVAQPGHGFVQQFRQRSEQFCQRLRGGRRQVVDADAGHPEHDIFGRGTIGLRQRPLRQGKARAGAQGTHGRARLPQLGARFARLHLQCRIVLRLHAIRIPVLARRIVAFQHGSMLAADGHIRRHAGGDRLFGLVIVAQHATQPHMQAAPSAQRLHAVTRFAGPGAMKAQAAALRAAGVLGRGAHMAAVGKDDHGLTVKPPGQPFFRQQPAHEIVVRFPVLAAIAALARLLHERCHLVAPAPQRVWRIRLQYLVDDGRHAPVLPDAAVARLRQQPQPWGDAQPVARQAAIAAQRGRGADIAGKRRARAVRQADVQAGRLAQQGRQRHMGAGGQGDDVARANFLQPLVGGKGFDQQAAVLSIIADGQCIQACLAVEGGYRANDILCQKMLFIWRVASHIAY